MSLPNLSALSTTETDPDFELLSESLDGFGFDVEAKKKEGRPARGAKAKAALKAKADAKDREEAAKIRSDTVKRRKRAAKAEAKFAKKNREAVKAENESKLSIAKADAANDKDTKETNDKIASVKPNGNSSNENEEEEGE
jgi:hypothetical protein